MIPSPEFYAHSECIHMMCAKLMTVKSIVLLGLVAGAMLMGGCASNTEKFRTEGIKLYNEERYDQSLAAFDKALTYDQFDPQSNAYAGLIYYRAGKYVQAAYHFKTALQADPSDEQAKAGLTSTYIKMGKPDEALDFLERSSEMAGKVDDPRYKKTFVNRRYQSQTEEALFLGKVGDRLRIGATYEKLGDLDNAILYYKKAEALEPENVNVLMAIASVYEKAGNRAGVREYLAKAYRADPGAKGLTEAMKRNGVTISEVVGSVPADGGALVPAAK